MPAAASTDSLQPGHAFLDAHGRHWEIEAIGKREDGSVGFLRVLLAFPAASTPNAHLVMTTQEFDLLLQRSGMRRSRNHGSH